MKRLLPFVLLGVITFHACAQEAAMENNVAVTYAIKSWKLNSSIGHRSIREKTNDKTDTRLAFLELNQFVTRRINPKLSVTLGLKYRDLNSNTGENEQRITQQAAYIHKYDHIRLVSRIRLEQRFRDHFVHRYRYRFSMDVPLSGEKLDTKEFYFLASNELIFQKSGSKNRIDNRVTAGIGYLFSTICKLQVDLTHRMEEINAETNHIPFLTTSLLFNVN